MFFSTLRGRGLMLAFCLLSLSFICQGQNIINGPNSVCPGETNTYNLRAPAWISADNIGGLRIINQTLPLFNIDGSLTITGSEQTVRVTGGIVTRVTFADGRTVANVNSPFFTQSIAGDRTQVIQECLSGIFVNNNNLTLDFALDCIGRIQEFNSQTIVAVDVLWDESRDNTCEANIFYEARQNLAVCGFKLDSEGNGGLPEYTCGTTIRNPNPDVTFNDDFEICVGAQPIDRIQSAGSGCFGSTNTYTAIYDQQSSDVEFVWTVNGVERPEANGSDELTIQEDYIGGRMYISVVAVSCNGNSIGEPVERIVVPPIANTQLTGPTCVYPGRLTYVLTVNGSMNRVDSVKIFPGNTPNLPINFYWNTDREIDFLAPYRTGDFSVVVYGIDECGAIRTMFHRFTVSTRCSTKPPTNGGPWTWNKSTTTDQPTPRKEPGSTTAKVFPNPASDRIKFVTPQDDEIRELTILDMNGRTILQPFVGTGIESIDISLDGLKDGVYLLRATGKEDSYTKQFMVKH